MILRWLLVLFWLTGAGITKAWSAEQDAPVTAQPIPYFELSDPAKKQFGKLQFVGGMVLRSKNPHFGAISGMRIKADTQLTAITDTGFWFTANIDRDDGSRPTGLSNGKIADVLNEAGRPFHQKWSSDFEGLTFDGDRAFVSTEMDMRVIRFEPTDGPLVQTRSKRITPRFNEPGLSVNFSFEAIATLPKNHPMAPGQIILSETNAEGGDNAIGFILTENQRLPLHVRLRDGLWITDADFLPNGDLLLLERRFSLIKGPLMSIRRIAGADIVEGAVLDGEVVMEAGPGKLLDNMEALSVFTDKDGNTRIAVMSDNNHWLMQRTIYLEFILKAS